MNSSQIKAIILKHLGNYNPAKIGIFGSYARGENNENSDLDVLVEFKETPSLLTLVRLENELTELLMVKVDLVTTGALKNKRIRNSINKDLISIL